MRNFKKHLIFKNNTIKEALAKLNELAGDAILFVIDEQERLIGSLTDGDIRRGFLQGLLLESDVSHFIQENPKFLRKGNYTIQEVIDFRNKDFKIIPIIDQENRIQNVLNFRFHKSYLPIDAIIMAGGRGERLKPLTDNIPKPLLKIGNKPIIEHNVDRLISFGIDDLWISVRYLGEQIEDYLKDGATKGANIQYIREKSPLGTIGAASKAKITEHEYVMVINSDILTNLDFEDFFLDFIAKEATFSVVTIPYYVEIPYAVIETKNENVISFKEKPTYTYYSNGGIYLMKKACLNLIPRDILFNTTDLMDLLIANGEKVSSYPLRGYWLDIGRHEDYLKAQEDIKHLSL
jgi:dTDP-glucose pyrophosphorylase